MIKLKRKKTNDNLIVNTQNSQIWQEQDVMEIVADPLVVREFVNSKLMPDIPNTNFQSSREMSSDNYVSSIIYAHDTTQQTQIDGVVPQADNLNPWLNNLNLDLQSTNRDKYLVNDTVSYETDCDNCYNVYSSQTNAYRPDYASCSAYFNCDNIVGQDNISVDDITYSSQSQVELQREYIEQTNIETSSAVDVSDMVEQNIGQQLQSSAHDISKIIDQNITKELTVHKPLNIRAEVIRRKSLIKLIAFVLAIVVVVTIAIVLGFLVVQNTTVSNIQGYSVVVADIGFC
jgi:hypothetical protein